MPNQTQIRPSLAPPLRAMSIADLNLLVAATADNSALLSLHTTLKLMANTGMRSGEIVRLTWADVDLEQNRAFVYGSKGINKRTVFLGPKTSHFLGSLRECNPGDIYILGGAAPHRVEGILRKFKLVCNKLGLIGARLHTVRTSCLIRLFFAGVDALTLSYIGNTSKHYQSLQFDSQGTSGTGFSVFEEV